jgi:hypothetical protein
MKTPPVETPPTFEEILKAKNDFVKAAYFAILTEVKELIRLYPTEYLRTFLEVDYAQIGYSNQHGFYSPMLHLRFEEQKGECSIYFARNFNIKQQVGYLLDSLLTRCVFKHTDATAEGINIEDCLNISLLKLDDYFEAKSLLDKGFKGATKVTVEQLKKEV